MNDNGALAPIYCENERVDIMATLISTRLVDHQGLVQSGV